GDVLGFCPTEALVADQEDVGDRRRGALAGGPALLEGAAGETASHGFTEAPGAGDELPLGDRSFDGNRKRHDGKRHDDAHGAITLKEELLDRLFHELTP